MSDTGNGMQTVTITVGAAGIYNDFSSASVSAKINSELAAVPQGTQIDLVFEPGVYALASTILLPSNTNVIGNGATLMALSGTSFNGSSLISNADSYHIGNNLYDKNTDGTVTYKPYNANSTVTMTTNSSTAIIDSNIMVSGLVFNEAGNSLDTSAYNDVDKQANIFGTWFTNAENVCVQDNVYIGGCDANAFVNVVNGVVANNIAIGQMAAYDNWDGPVNITIEDNEAWQYSINDQAVASAVQINSTPTGDPNNPGTASNDSIIDNLLSGNTPGLLSAAATWPLPGYSSTLTPTFDITQQGNIDSLLNTPDAQGYYMDYTQGSTVEDNIISQAVLTTLVSSSIIQDINWAASATSYGEFSGNLIVGAFLSKTGTPLIVSQGIGSAISDNAILGENEGNSQAFLGTSLTGNISNVGTTLSGTETPQTLAIVAESDIILTSSSQIELKGSLAPEIVDVSGSTLETVSLITQFGSLTLSGDTFANVTSANGETTVVLSGSLDQVNALLANLVYVPSAFGFSDSIEMVVHDAEGHSSTRYIPIIEDAGISDLPEVVTIGAGFLSTLPQASTLYAGLGLPSQATLSGEVLIAEGTNNLLNMGSTVSVAYLGAGSSTVQGGSNQGFIETGSGNAILNLTGTGKITVAGGAGDLTVNANTSFTGATDLIEPGASNATIYGGASEISVICGLGNLTFDGGNGGTYLTTLPEDGGAVRANLGSGNSTVFALSGDVALSTEVGTTNDIYLGISLTTLYSSGADNLVLGAGSTTVEAGAGAHDVVLAGTGLITYFDDVVSASADSGVLVLGGPIGTTISNVSAGADVLVLQSGDIVTAQGDLSVRGGQRNDTVFGGIGLLTYVQDAASSDTVIADEYGEANISFSEGADTYVGGAGVGNIVLNGAQSANITLGKGGGSVSVENCGNAKVRTSFGGTTKVSEVSGNSVQVTVSSYGNDQISAGGSLVVNSYGGSLDEIETQGVATINVFGGAHDDVVSTGTLVLKAGVNSTIRPMPATVPSLSTANIDVNAGLATVSAVNLSLVYAEVQNASLNFINSSLLQQTVIGGAGAHVTVSGGAGGGLYIGGAGGSNELIGGDGVVTLKGGGAGDYLQANSALGTNQIEAGVGAETLNASSSSGSNEFVIGPGSQVNASSQGSGVQTFILNAGTGGTATLTGSAVLSAFNVFDIETGSGYDSVRYFVRNFNVGNSEIDITNLVNSGAPDTSMVSIMSASGMSGAVVQLGDGTSITLSNCEASQLYVIHTQDGGIRIL